MEYGPKLGGGTFWKPLAAGEFVEVVYRSKEQATGKYEGMNAVCELIDARPAIAGLAPGGVIKVGISAGLKTAFEILRPGQAAKIVYLGNQKNPKSGQTFKAFDVFPAKGQPQPVAAGATSEGDDGVPF